MTGRLSAKLLAPGKISDRQYGFRPHRSTEDAIVELRRMVSSSDKKQVVALFFDIKGAFDSIWRSAILKSLKDMGCRRNVYEVLQSYFVDRTVKMEFGSVEITRVAVHGCRQGSVFRLMGWNFGFDLLLEILEARFGGRSVAYAGDLLVVIDGNSRVELKRLDQNVVNRMLE